MKPGKYRPTDEQVVITPKDISRMLLMFPYPILITFAYLLLGAVFGLWHPMWLLFLTIPIYYMLAANKSLIKVFYASWQNRVFDDDDDD